MILDELQLRQLALPLIDSLPAAHGVIDTRPTILVAACADGFVGWGECVALADPGYLDEWSDGEYDVLRSALLPRLVDGSDVQAGEVGERLADVSGHRTAKAAVEMALIDLHLRQQGRHLADAIGAVEESVGCCIVIGLKPIDHVLAQVAQQIDEGYDTFKLKIAPGDDVERVAAVRDAFPRVVIRADANGSYSWAEPDHRKALHSLADHGVTLLEQPLSPAQNAAMVELRDELDTPVTLDESIVSLSTALDCVASRTVDVMTVKPGPIGGLAAAVAVHDACQEIDMPLTLGGMVDGGLSRAANLAVAAMPGYSGRAAEVSPDGRWFSESFLKQSVEAVDGRLEVPTGPGVGVDIDEEVVDRLTLRGSSFSRR